MDLFGVIQWCFRDSRCGFATIIVGWLLFSGLAMVAAALRGGK